MQVFKVDIFISQVGNLSQKECNGKPDENWHFCLYKENFIFPGHFYYGIESN
jgi:hypothetical protein